MCFSQIAPPGSVCLENRLTINPGYGNTFKECYPQETHAAGCIVVKQLEHIHATLHTKTTRNTGRGLAGAHT